MIAGYDTLDDIAMDACQDLQDYDWHYYYNMQRYGIRCLNEMHISFMNRPKEVYLEVDQSTKTVTLPSDYKNYIKVSVEYNGILWALGLNERMCRPMRDECGDYILGDGGLVTGTKHQWNYYTAENSEWNGNYWYWWMNEFSGSKQYGWGGGYNSQGYYRVDDTKGVILLNPDFAWSHIVLTYIGEVYVPGVTTYVPSMAREAIACGMKYYFLEMMKNTTGKGEMRDYKIKAADAGAAYWAAVRKSAQRMKANSPYELVAAYRRSVGPMVRG